MLLAIISTIFMGFAAVLQGGMNQKIAESWGLTGAILLNCIVLIVISSILYIWMKFYPITSDPLFQDKASFRNFSWWYLLPGLFGYSIIVGSPWVISRIGALQLFIGLIGSQLIGSLVWDYYVEQIPISPQRILGACLAFFSIFVASWR